MKKIFIVIFSLILIQTNFIVAQKYQGQIKTIDSIFTDCLKDAPSYSIVVVKDGKVVEKKSFGFGNLEEQIKASSITNYRLASVTKQFTAMCILMLCNEGKLSLSTTLKSIYPDFPEYGSKITIEQILTHTSGLLSYEDSVPDDSKMQIKDNEVLALMKRVDSTYFPPGSKYEYSNTGYVILGGIVEKISGKSFPQFLKERIFDPLKMFSTVAHVEGKSIVPNRSYGYSKKDGKFIRTDQSPTSATLGDGGIYCSIDDYLKWERTLTTTKLLPKKIMDKIFENHILEKGKPILPGYGYGWRISEVDNFKCIEHGGGTRGFSHQVTRLPEKNITVVVFSNGNQVQELRELTIKIIKLFL